MKINIDIHKICRIAYRKLDTGTHRGTGRQTESGTRTQTHTQSKTQKNTPDR